METPKYENPLPPGSETPLSERPRNLALGALCMIGSALLFAMLGAIVKRLSADLATPTVVFLRNFFGLLTLVPWLYIHRKEGVRTKLRALHLLRAATGLSAMYCWFYAYRIVPLAEVDVLSKSLPLFIPLIAWLGLKEKASSASLLAIAVGFLGVMLVVRPGSMVFLPGHLIVILGGALGAGAMVTIRRLSSEEPIIRIVFYFGLISTIVSALGPILHPEAVPRTLWPWVILLGCTATSGQLLLTKAYSLAPASQVAPFSYATVIFSALFAWVFWRERMDALSWAGAGVIGLAGLIAGRQVGRRARSSAVVGRPGNTREG
jgi:drug/metabolite transporter (DMT)-like permease